jgi:hypothetical protein
MSQTLVEYLDADDGEFDDAEFDDSEFDDSEFDDSEFDDAEFDDSEFDDGEASRRRRQPARRRGRRRGPARSRRRAAGRVPARRPRSAAAAFRAVDANRKASESELRSEINQLKKDGQWASWVTVATALVGAGLAIRKPDNVWVETLVRAAPLAALKPPRGAKGGAAMLTQPRVLGPALMAATTFVGTKVNQKRIDVPSGTVEVPVGKSVMIFASVVSASGAPTGDVVTFMPQDPSIADFVAGKGIDGKAAGYTKITATAPGVPSATITVHVS